MDTHPGEGIKIALVVAITVAVVGFFAGISDEVDDASPLAVLHTDVAANDAPAARSWKEMRDTPRGSSSGWSADLVRLRGEAPTRLDTFDPTTLSREDAVTDRMGNRAYDGAPPTVPHPVRQDSAAECLACHDEGLRLRGVTASMMSHRELTNCTQCHVTSSAPMPADTWLAREVGENKFVGSWPKVGGDRAWSIAPPVIPHGTQMREACLSCHGPLGRDAMRASHTERENCVQCHAVNATLERRPEVLSLGPGGAVP